MPVMELGYLAHPEADKCFIVTLDYEGMSIFVWARFHAEARRYGADCLDSDWDSVECRRFPKLDHFEGDLLSWCLDDGWSFSCSHCDKRVGSSDPGFYRDGDDLFCSVEHAEYYRAYWAERAALEKRFLAYAQSKWPGDAAVRAHINPSGDGVVLMKDDGYQIIDRRSLPDLST